MYLETTMPRRHSRRASLVGWLRHAVTLRHHRRSLGLLDRHLLRDIGLTEAEARREAERPFWDAPNHWFR